MTRHVLRSGAQTSLQGAPYAASCAAVYGARRSGGTVRLPLALRRIHEKLKDPVELYKPHLKHRHMNLDQFKRRTAALQFPKEIYDLYVQLVKKCSICQEHKRAPSREKVSGLRSEVFGDLTFADHGELPIPNYPL